MVRTKPRGQEAFGSAKSFLRDVQEGQMGEIEYCKHNVLPAAEQQWEQVYEVNKKAQLRGQFKELPKHELQHQVEARGASTTPTPPKSSLIEALVEDEYTPPPRSSDTPVQKRLASLSRWSGRAVSKRRKLDFG